MKQFRILVLIGLFHIRPGQASAPNPSPPISLTSGEDHGNPSAAADLYGTGIRIGIYMQTIGMLMSLVCAEQPRFKFAAATTSIAVLLSWTILAQRESFSACEAWLILSIIGTFVFPGGAALCNITDVAGEGIGIVAIWISILWLFSSVIWLFASLITNLPALDTSNAVWIFKREQIDNWFHILMLVIGCVLLATSFIMALSSTILIRKAIRAWYTGETHSNVTWTCEERKALESFRYSQCFAGLLLWILAIISCEKIIQWNDLSPENDLSSPGQAIPLVVGILILIDGIGDILKDPSRLLRPQTWVFVFRQVIVGSLTNIVRITSILMYHRRPRTSHGTKIKAVIFDFVGTCSDWHSSILPALPANIRSDTKSRFACEWRQAYVNTNAALSRVGNPPEDSNITYQRTLLGVLQRHPSMASSFTQDAQDKAIAAWHVQRAWPDVAEALQKLKQERKCEVYVHTNDTTRLQLNLLRSSGLEFTMIFSGELLGHYKPVPESYRGVLHLLELRAEECVAVAAHASDLRGAKAVGMKTVYVRRWPEDVHEVAQVVKAENDAYIEGMHELDQVISRL